MNENRLLNFCLRPILKLNDAWLVLIWSQWKQLLTDSNCIYVINNYQGFLKQNFNCDLNQDYISDFSHFW